MKTTFKLYRYENLIKTDMLYIEELPEERTYKIRVEGDNIEEILNRIYLPERLKQQMRDDIVNIVKGYDLVAMQLGVYTKENNELCKKYFRDMLDKFCKIHGSYYKFEEDQI